MRLQGNGNDEPPVPPTQTPDAPVREPDDAPSGPGAPVDEPEPKGPRKL